MNKTPIKYVNKTIFSPTKTPNNFTNELKYVLGERNALKSRNKVCAILDNSIQQNDLSFLGHLNNDLDKRRQFRLQAIEEIFQSEKSYLNQLEKLMNFFITPLKEQKIINVSSHTLLFGHIEMIYNLNGELIKILDENLDNVAKAFLKTAPFFKLYSVYAFDYTNALLTLQELIEKNEKFRKFLEETESKPNIQTKLNSLMIIPIQRVPRYKLLLEQVLLYTSPADSDYRLIKESIKEIENTVSHINSVIQDQEITQNLLNLQNSLVNRIPKIVKPSRKIIREGILNKVTRNGQQIKRYCVLMSDLFMYCKMIKDRTEHCLIENSLECCCILPLKKCKIFEMFPGNFKISCQGDGVILSTSDLYLAGRWIGAIRDAIDTYVECRKTLRKESSKRRPMRKKNVKNLDADDARKSDFESIYRGYVDSDDEDVKTSGSITNFLSNRIPRLLKRKFESTCSAFYSSNPKIEIKQVKSPFKNKNRKKLTRKPSYIASAMTSTFLNKKINSDEVCEEVDPSYGFAGRYSDTKSYFRTNNVDNNIPNSIKSDLQITNEGFIKSDNSKPLTSFMHKGTSNYDKENNFIHKKRIKFNSSSNERETETRLEFNPYYDTAMVNRKEDTIDRYYKPKPFDFSINYKKETLKDRILNFFTGLF